MTANDLPRRPLASLLLIGAFLLSVPMAVSSTSGHDYQTLKVLSGEEDVTSKVLVKDFKTKDCKNFSSSFERSHLPPALQSDLLSVQRPGSFHVVPHYSEDHYDGVMQLYTGVVVDWTSPVSDSAKQHVQGFFLDVRYKDDSFKLCRLFQVNHTQHLKTQLSFRYSFQNFGFRPDSYHLRVYSLPPPSKKGASKRDMYRSEDCSLSGLTEYADLSGPAKWRPSFVWSTSPKTVRVGVPSLCELPNSNLQDFTTFNVSLQLKPDTHNYFRRKQLNVSCHDEPANSPESSVTFDNLEEGEYRVTVVPLERENKNDTNCLCWIHLDDSRPRECQTACSVSAGPWFDLVTGKEVKGPEEANCNVTVTADDIVSLTRQTTAKVGYSSAQEEKKSPGYLLPVVVGVAVVLAIFIPFLIIYRWKRKNKGSQSSSGPKKPTPSSHKSLPLQPAMLSAKSLGSMDLCYISQWQRSDQVKLPQLCSKNVFVLHSGDHMQHCQLVKNFCHFLQVHCHCHITCSSDHDLCTSNHSWVVANMNRADLILFVDSEGAHSYVQSYINGTTYQPQFQAEVDRTFVMGVKYIFELEMEKKDRVVLVNFDRERSKKELLASMSFGLPQHLPGLLKAIHGLKTDEFHKHSGCIPTDPYCLSRLPDGEKLLESIQSVQRFQKEHPNWFAQFHGKPSPADSPSGKSATDSNYFSMESQSQTSSQPQKGTVSPVSVSQIASPAFANTDPDDKSAFAFTVYNRGENPEKPVQVCGRSVVTIYDSDHFSLGPDKDKHQAPCTGLTIVPPRSDSVLMSSGDTVSQMLNHFNKA